tara:strand:+ start:1252 stop:1566 length:315 start_codon:yes stop_codon:yes gene_type:complete
MKKISLILFLTIAFLTFQSCQTVKEGFTSQKKKSTDEFLVEKKSPLVMPPEFNELPIPKTSNNIAEIESENNIESLISNNNSPENSEVQNENFENLIIEKIKQN